MKFFVYDDVNGTLSINDESILMIREIVALMEPSRNKTKNDKTGKERTLATKELKYIYLFLDWESPYFQYAEQDKHRESLLDSGLSEVGFNDELFKAACRKYDEIQNSSLSMRLLKSARSAIEKQIHYLENVDLEERDPVTGKPIFKSKDLISEIKGSKDLIVALNDLETQVKKEIDTGSSLRGDVAPGMFD